VKGPPKLRVHRSATRFRVPDVTVLDQDTPKEQIITHPPLAVFEILSAEDTVTRLLGKLADYAAMSIEGVFVIDPATNAYYIYQRGNFGHIGSLCTISRSKIDFDEIKGLLPLDEEHRNGPAISPSQAAQCSTPHPSSDRSSASLSHNRRR
jgi:hypothetical protein